MSINESHWSRIAGAFEKIADAVEKLVDSKTASKPEITAADLVEQTKQSLAEGVQKNSIMHDKPASTQAKRMREREVSMEPAVNRQNDDEGF